MATGMSSYLAHAILDAIFNAGSLSGITPYLSLHTGDPGDNGANEVSGGTGPYARVNASAKFAAAADRECANDVEVQFTGLPTCSVSHVGIWTAATSGTFLWGQELTATRAFDSGDFGSFAVGEFVASLPLPS